MALPGLDSPPDYFSYATGLTATLAGLAFTQQSAEHLFGTRSERWLYLPRLILSVLLVAGWHREWILIGLLILGIGMLLRFQGPYNGGSDRLSLLILVCMTAIAWLPSRYWQEVCFGYLAAQVTLSYFIAGWVKVINPDWRSGRALQDVFAWSNYPVSESLRQWATRPRLLWTMSWCVMLLELLFPMSLLNRTSLACALALTATFHLANACLFGLNRFFWIWIASYPSILWLQTRAI